MSLNRESAMNIANVLTEALPYIQRFTGKTVVVKFGATLWKAKNCKTVLRAT
jgi:hypothetical protein